MASEELAKSIQPTAPDAVPNNADGMGVHSHIFGDAEGESHPLSPDQPQQEMAADFPESKPGIELTSDGEEHPSAEKDKDDASIASIDLEEERFLRGKNYQRKWRGTHTSHIADIHKKNSTKYARAASLYTEGLEDRVGVLEKELLELHKENAPTLSSPCAEPLPLKVIQSSLKDWKGKRLFDKKAKACIFLATTSESSSFQVDPIQSNAHSQGTNHQDSVQDPNHDNIDHVAGVQYPGTFDFARLHFSSPWPSILIELLSGEAVSEVRSWIYPFKHIVVYEKQFRKCVELLNETNVDDVEAKNLSPHLNRIVSEIVRTLGPKRGDVELSNTYVSGVLLKMDALKNHHLKVEKSSSKDVEEELEDDTESQPDLSSMSPVANSNIEVSKQLNIAPEADPVPDKNPYMCTCLKDARDHLQLLVSTMDSHLGSLLTLHNAIRDRSISRIRFEHLWHLFQPGDLVVTSKQPHQAYRVINVSGGRPLLTTKEVLLDDRPVSDKPFFRRQSQLSPFKIDCVRFDFDGEIFGPIQDTISIFEYEEDRIITKLDVYPMKCAEKEEEVAQSLLDRGRRFAEYRDFRHRRYDGLSLGEPQEEIESEVIIDFTQSFRQHDYAKEKPQIGLQGAAMADERETYEDLCPATGKQCMDLTHNGLVDDAVFDKQRMDRFLNYESQGMFTESRVGNQTLSSDQLILLPCRVHGFSLRSRKWVPLNIDCLREIKENEAFEGQNTGFDDLVIPDEYKRIVKALVKSHALGLRPTENEGKDRQQIDLVRGKGKGLFILLHGVPGVGKTSTAESVASYTGRPLFPITCGDIGQTAEDLEDNLEAIFLLARKWGCVLLLDEADVFLAKRERGGDSVDRNALVSVFLRTLEYYSGILFLTTNRIGSFDEAFKSRIHISLYYAPLNESQTIEVWTMNLNRLSKSNRDIYVDRSEIEGFARNHWKDGKRWNGRQIRNAFQTAIALAEYEFQEKCQKCEKTGDKPPFRPGLEDKHFRAVAKTSAEFDDYLQSVMHSQTYEQKALMSEMRNDAYDPDRGTETPSGKKYNYQRAVRQNRLGEPAPPVREADKSTRQTETPPATPQLMSGASVGSSAPLDEEEEYRQFKAEMEQKKQAEKMERFRKMHEMEQMGR